MGWFARIERSDFPRWYITMNEKVTFIVPGTSEPYTATFQEDFAFAFTHRGAQRKAKRMVGRRNRAAALEPEVVL